MANKPVKRLYRLTSDGKIAGVCSGIAKYLNVDPVIIRLAWVVFTLLSFGVGILAYLIAWLIIPKQPE
jgi:phage shock protein PspC (stress-responsive transcriptional regulator)